MSRYYDVIMTSRIWKIACFVNILFSLQEYFATSNFYWKRTSCFQISHIFTYLICRETIAYYYDVKKLCKINYISVIWWIPESLPHPDRTLSPVIFGLEESAIISPWSIISIYKTKNINYWAKICLKKKLLKSTFNKSVTMETEHALINFLPKI